MSDAPELLPCPFCGEELFVSKSGLAIHQGQSQSTCMIGSVGIPVDHQPSVDKWNTRIRPHADARAALKARDKRKKKEALREAADSFLETEIKLNGASHPRPDRRRRQGAMIQ